MIFFFFVKNNLVIINVFLVYYNLKPILIILLIRVRVRNCRYKIAYYKCYITTERIIR